MLRAMCCSDRQEKEVHQMFIAMNWLGVAKGSEEAFEQVWMPRDSQNVPKFVEFHDWRE
jgi:heme-degrading monooxygenase HmoA